MGAFWKPPTPHPGLSSPPSLCISESTIGELVWPRERKTNFLSFGSDTSIHSHFHSIQTVNYSLSLLCLVPPFFSLRRSLPRLLPILPVLSGCVVCSEDHDTVANSSRAGCYVDSVSLGFPGLAGFSLFTIPLASVFLFSPSAG